MTRTWILAATALLCACSPVTEETYPQEAAKATCSYLEECEQSSYNQQYNDRDDCIEAIADATELAIQAADVLGFTDGCEWDSQTAREHVKAIRKTECGEDLPSLPDLYDCPT